MKSQVIFKNHSNCSPPGQEHGTDNSQYYLKAIFINSQSKICFTLVSFRLLFAAGFVGLALTLTRRRWSIGSLTVVASNRNLPIRWTSSKNNQYCGYITLLWYLMNNCIGGLSLRFSANSFCVFWKITFCDVTAFCPFLTKVNRWFFRCASWGEL